MAGTVCEVDSNESARAAASGGGFGRRMAVVGSLVVSAAFLVASVGGASAAPGAASAPQAVAAPAAPLALGAASGSGSRPAAPVAASRTAAPSPCPATYTVRFGDGWITIASRLGVKVSELYRLNSASSRTPLYAGRTVCVPTGARGATPVTTVRSTPVSGSSSCATRYTVRPGDGWTMIAARHKVSLSALYSINKASSRTPLYAGRTICLPASASTPATTAAPTTTKPAVTGGSTTCAKRYTIRPGDAWTTIAARHKVPVGTLYSLNKASSRTVLFAGRTICLPSNATTPTTAAPPATAAPTTTVRPAPTTTAKPVTTVPATKTSWTQAEVIAIIRQVWPDHLEDKAIEIAWRESNHKPGVRNYCCFGLFQIYWNVHKGWLSSIGITSAEQLYHPQANAYAALVLYNRAGGWGPWAMTAG